MGGDVDRRGRGARGGRADAETPAAARARELDALASRRFDLLVIGGGITGAATARDAALRGMQVALVERDDFASGTSSRSSRLIHGGLRYLEHGHLKLVFESSGERRRLLRLAPHLVRPLPFTWPVYAGARVPQWKLRAGMVLYDALAFFRNAGDHESLDPDETLAREPALRPDGLRGGERYFDAATDDSRLTLANAQGAAEEGAVVVNHAEVTSLLFREGATAGAVVRDVLTGREITVQARAVVSAVGPWTDELRRLEMPGTPPSVRGTKGVHIAVPRERIGNRDALTLLSPIDGRVMFVLPAGTHAIIGTTDTPTDEPPGDVRASEADVEYLLRTASAFFPAARLTRSDVVSAWAGIRPLVAAAYGAGPSSASREHSVARSPRGLIVVTGGKLTTYRVIAADVVREVERVLRREPRPVPTDDAPLPGADFASLDAERRAAAQRTGNRAVGDRLVFAHGSAWRSVLGLADRDPSLATPLVAGLPYLRAEVAWAVLHERACTLADVLVRRMPVAFETRDNGRVAAIDASSIMAGLLGWDSEQVRRAIDGYDADVSRMFGVT